MGMDSWIDKILYIGYSQYFEKPIQQHLYIMELTSEKNHRWFRSKGSYQPTYYQHDPICGGNM